MVRNAVLICVTMALANVGPAHAKERQSSGSSKMCWMDYCPCQETNGISRILCRNLKGGIPVSNEMMAAGAAQRDAQRELDDWYRDNPEYRP